jgi:hypothetical protein
MRARSSASQDQTTIHGADREVLRRDHLRWRLRWISMEAQQGQVTVRAAVHALDAALAEHRRGLALAAGRRERERMTRGREVKAAASLFAADRDLSERHAEHARVESCAAELAVRLGPRRIGEAADAAAARDRLEQARAHLAAAPEQPYAWIADFAPAVAGAMLRDLPADRLHAARTAVAHLVTGLRDPEPLLALAATDPATVVAVTRERVFVATAATVEPHPAAQVDVADGALGVAGREIATGLAENRPGRLATVLELVKDAYRLPT